jgi:antitoxin component YwqK of YwqJK toxin-antitoxin module
MCATEFRSLYWGHTEKYSFKNKKVGMKQYRSDCPLRLGGCLALIGLALFLFSSIMTAQIPSSPNQRDQKGEKTGKWTIMFDEDLKIVDDVNRANYFRIINYANGEPFGLVRDYYATGVLQWEGYLSSESPDSLVGYSIFYFDNGKKSFEGKVGNSRQDSVWRYYHRNGQKWSEILYDEGRMIEVFFNRDSTGKDLPNGTLKSGNGGYTSYFEDGKVQFEGNYRNGLLEGKCIEWDQEGRKSEGSYTEGKKEGCWVINKMDSSSWEAGYYHNGYKQGKWTSHSIDGTDNIYSYRDGILDPKTTIIHPDGRKFDYLEISDNLAEVTEWYQTGEKAYQGHFRDKERDGKWVFWDRSGNKSEEAQFSYGKRQGVSVIFFSDGDRQEGLYFQNKKVGKWKLYGSTDALKDSCEVENGRTKWEK